LEEGFPGNFKVSVDVLTASAELKAPDDVLLKPLIQLLRLLSCVSYDCIHIKLLKLFEVAPGDIDDKFSHSELGLCKNKNFLMEEGAYQSGRRSG